MTQSEKFQVYDLLKTISDSVYGFSSPSFPENRPEFIDDAPNNNFISQEKKVEQVECSGNLEEIAEQISKCNKCILCQNRTNTVSGMGNTNPFVLVIGEGPGEQEDLQGLPFVGPAGQLLDKMLGAINLSRDKNCYITNIVKCRPPNNRTPTPEESATCIGYLKAQIKELKPKAILTVGTTAIKALLNTQTGITKLHGQLMEYDGVPLLATYHPSLLLRIPDYKKIAWADLKIFRAKLQELDPNYMN